MTRSPSPEFDDQDWEGVQDGTALFVPLAFLLGVAYGYGRAMGLYNWQAVLAGLVPAYITGRALGWVWTRFADSFNSH
jgi:hypothetical protein